MFSNQTSLCLVPSTGLSPMVDKRKFHKLIEYRTFPSLSTTQKEGIGKKLRKLRLLFRTLHRGEDKR